MTGAGATASSSRGAIETGFGTFGVPHDVVSWSALLLALGLFVVALHKPWRALVWRLMQAHPRRAVALLALCASSLSLAYVAYYLRGGPRIIDATSYFLEARSLASGALTFHVPDPAGSFQGRFLVSLPGVPGRLSPIFPPGYPALLAVGFWVGAPMLIGPALAAALVIATYALARRWFDARVAFGAAALSVVCATLRYHTADTMSHGLSALLVTVGLWIVSGQKRHRFLLCGLCAGWVCATRPVSGLALLACLGLFWVRRPRNGLELALGLVPGLAGLVLHQWLATGDPLQSVQRYYYALADGPPGCFAYGFGSEVGCRGEHGDFVNRYLPQGYGLVAALGTTGRRLAMHLRDAANVELGFLVLPLALVLDREKPESRRLLAMVGIWIVAYAPFYFDGNYPGGGARFFADVLPLEHILLARVALRGGFLPLAPALSVLGFALHTNFDHRALAERDGGRPMFEPELLAHNEVEHGLVFVTTDHGFNLGFDPRSLDPETGVVVARQRGDIYDRMLYERLGKPRSYLYRFDYTEKAAEPHLENWQPPPSRVLRFEHQWPALSATHGWLERRESSEKGEGTVLVLHHAEPPSDDPASFELELAVPGDPSGEALAPVLAWSGLGAEPCPTELRFTVQTADAAPSKSVDAANCRGVHEVPIELPKPGAGGETQQLGSARLQVTLSGGDLELHQMAF